MLELPEGFLRGFSIVVAHDDNLGIGRSECIPWHVPEDLRHFKEVTTTQVEGKFKPVVIMGMSTWYSINSRPLPGRENVVVSRKYREIAEVSSYTDLNMAISAICRAHRCGDVFVIGGGQIYSQVLSHPALSTIYATEIKGNYECDVTIPEYRYDRFAIADATPWLKSERGVSYRFLKYVTK